MAIQTPTFKDYLKKRMIEPNCPVGEGFDELIQNQEKTFGKVLKELGF